MDRQFNHKVNTFQKLASKRDAEDYSVKDDKFHCKTPGCMEFTVDVYPTEWFPHPVNGVSLINSAEYVSHRGSLLSLQPWIFRKESYLRDEEIKKVVEDYSKLREREMDGLVNNLLGESTSRRVNLSHAHGRGQSCLRSRCSCCGTSRPLSSMKDFLIPQLYNENFGSEELVFGSVPSSTTSGIRPFVTNGSKITSELDNKIYVKNVSGVSTPKLRTAKGNCSETPHEKLVHSNTIVQDSVDALHIFSVGVSLGLLSTILSNRKEIDNLNTMLKSSENLVRDLQEEMDTRTVKELVDEVAGRQKPSSDMVLNFEPVVKDDNDQVCLPTEESRKEIEAELQIELEKLEMDMNSSLFSAKKSVLDESTNASDCTSSTDQALDANYSVSPQELSLRLHEVIRLRLQERIEELERELQRTQKHLQLVESDCLGCQRGSYDEVYRDFSMVANMEENQPFTTNSKDRVECYLHSSDENLIWEREELGSLGEEPLWDQKLKDKGLLADAMGEGDCVDDEEMMTLITQILEKTRQGSPIVQDVQRMLFELND